MEIKLTPTQAADLLDPETSRETIWAIEAEGKDGLAYVNEACRMAAVALRGLQDG